MKTRERIIHAALELFNLHGEQNITTNHIASHLGMSPGNLYYHFRNKEDIIQGIFELYAEDLQALCEDWSMLTKRGQQSVQDNLQHCERVLQLIWHFRFAYDNLPDILARNDALGTWYSQIQEPIYAAMRQQIQQMRETGLLQANEEEQENLLHITKQLLIFWIAYLHTLTPGRSLEWRDICGVIPRVLFLFRPYVTAPYQADLARLETHFAAKAAAHEPSPAFGEG